MSNLTQFFGGVKNVQRFSGTIAAGLASIDITISSVNTNKTFIVLYTDSYASSNVGQIPWINSNIITFINSTTVRIDKRYTTGSNTYSFQLVEYN